MDVNEVWGVPKKKIEEFFLSQQDVSPCGENLFEFRGCSIRVTELPEREAGPFTFPNSSVEFCGPESDTKEIYRRFVLRFISAGG